MGVARQAVTLLVLATIESSNPSSSTKFFCWGVAQLVQHLTVNQAELALITGSSPVAPAKIFTEISRSGLSHPTVYGVFAGSNPAIFAIFCKRVVQRLGRSSPKRTTVVRVHPLLPNFMKHDTVVIGNSFSSSSSCA